MDNYGYTIDFDKQRLQAITIHEDQMVIGISKQLLSRLDRKPRLADFQYLPVIYYNNE